MFSVIVKTVITVLVIWAVFTTFCHAGTKVPVCVTAALNQDGFVNANLANPVKDVTKQVKKSKELTLNCEAPSLTIVVLHRGVTGTGDTAYGYGVISEIKRKYMVGRLVLPDGRTTEVTQREGTMSRSWGHLAKKLREQVEDFIEMNGVK